jgi:hypothetical protein
MTDSKSENIIFRVAGTIDDIADSIIGVRLAEPVIKVGRELLPANVIRNVTGLEKPSEVIAPKIDEILEKIRSRVTTSIRR